MGVVAALGKAAGLIDKKKPKAAPEKDPGRAAEAAMAGQQAAAMRSRRRGFRSLLGRSDEGQTGLTDKLGG